MEVLAECAVLDISKLTDLQKILSQHNEDDVLYHGVVLLTEVLNKTRDAEIERQAFFGRNEKKACCLFDRHLVGFQDFVSRKDARITTVVKASLRDLFFKAKNFGDKGFAAEEVGKKLYDLFDEKGISATRTPSVPRLAWTDSMRSLRAVAPATPSSRESSFDDTEVVVAPGGSSPESVGSGELETRLPGMVV